MSVGAEHILPYYGSYCVFRVIKMLHEKLNGDFPWKVEIRIFRDGRNVAKTCSVFLHATIRHAGDEWWMNEGMGALLMGGAGAKEGSPQSHTEEHGVKQGDGSGLEYGRQASPWQDGSESCAVVQEAMLDYLPATLIASDRLTVPS